MKKLLMVISMAAAALMVGACGGGGSGNSTPAATASNTPPATPAGPVTNTIPVTVSSAFKGGTNVPYVSVTVCKSGTTTCTTINNVLLDTGSSGLRLMASALPAGWVNNLPETQTSGGYLGECAVFASGETWGQVVQADIHLAGEVAHNMPIQLIGVGTADIPQDCGEAGAEDMTLPSELLANGVLGVGTFQQDCGAACAQAVEPATYYSCSGAKCSNISVPLNQQVQNPVLGFASDNNGVSLAMNSISAAGQATASGTLTFGIGTQSDNALTAQNVIEADPTYAQFTTSFNGSTYPSFVDSGSNYLFFEDNAITPCSTTLAGTGFFCPASTETLNATVTAYSSTTPIATPFQIANAETVLGTSGNVAVNDIGADPGFSGTPMFTWGLPFFYGKTVVVGMEGKSVGSATGPFYAW